ncbi:MAG: tyrosine-protein phosphatase [Leucobacter sp.]
MLTKQLPTADVTVDTTVDTAVDVAMHRLHNLRPVGGLPTSTGEFVRGDLIWRSAAPLAERDSSTRTIIDLGVRTVIDLRDGAERDRTPGAWLHEALTVVPHAVFDDQLHSIHFAELAELYSLMVGDFGIRVAGAFSKVAANASAGVLFHCTAGKDRTGVLGALILEVLGVDRALTLADFALSQERLGEDYLDDLFKGLDVESLPGLAAHKATASPPELLAAALEEIDRTYGGVPAFLRAHGVSDAELHALREALLIEAA